MINKVGADRERASEESRVKFKNNEFPPVSA
jgi:hypothetical protein